MRFFTRLIFCSVLLGATALAAEDPDDDLYKEDAIRPYLDQLPEEQKGDDKQQVVIPPYPREEDLVEIQVGRYGYNYRVFVDRTSLSVGDDLVRYTVVLRSPSGVDNVSFEAIRCARRQYRRYAYGSGGQFHPAPGDDWQRIHRNRQNIYRSVLADDYFCPLPTGNVVAQLRKRLKPHGDFSYSEE